MTGDELRGRYESWDRSPNQDPSFRRARAEAYVAGYLARAAEQAKAEVARVLTEADTQAQAWDLGARLALTAVMASPEIAPAELIEHVLAHNPYGPVPDSQPVNAGHERNLIAAEELIAAIREDLDWAERQTDKPFSTNDQIVGGLVARITKRLGGDRG